MTPRRPSARLVRLRPGSAASLLFSSSPSRPRGDEPSRDRDVLVLDQGSSASPLFLRQPDSSRWVAPAGGPRLGARPCAPLFPAYWIVTAALFAANAGHELQAGILSLFVSQMLGLGTSGSRREHLINVPAGPCR